MGAIDTVKDIAKIAVTSGLSTEIIGLLEKKVTLLTEQVTTLEKENADLKKKVAHLEQQLASAEPAGDEDEELDEEAVKFLLVLAQAGPLHIPELARALGLSRVKTQYHKQSNKAYRDLFKGFEAPSIAWILAA